MIILNCMKAKLTEEIIQLGSVNQIYLEELSIWTILFFSIGVISIFFSLIINLRKKREIASCLMIGSYILLHAFFSICLSLHLFDIEIDNSKGLRLITIFTFLNEPLLYLYFKRISEKRQLKLRDLLHGLPIGFFLIYWFVYPVTLLRAIYFKLSLSVVYGFLAFKVFKRKEEIRIGTNFMVTQHIRYSYDLFICFRFFNVNLVENNTRFFWNIPAIILERSNDFVYGIYCIHQT